MYVAKYRKQKTENAEPRFYQEEQRRRDFEMDVISMAFFVVGDSKYEGDQLLQGQRISTN